MISSYISKIGVNVVYMHSIHRAIPWYKRASESFCFIAVANKQYIDHDRVLLYYKSFYFSSPL